MVSRFLTTGQAARLCSVTRDTVLKWIRAGQIPAQRTPGGHHRIDRRDLDRAVRRSTEAPDHRNPLAAHFSFQYCWEYLGRGDLPEQCSRCMVYLSRAQRCYELARIGSEVESTAAFCQNSCGDCEYFRKVSKQDLNILVVTDDPDLTTELQTSSEKARFNLRVASCEYDCSAVLNLISPDYVVVDCSLGPSFIEHISGHLSEDPRVPVLRLIVAGDETEFPEDCATGVFARIRRPLTVDRINACLDSLWGRSQEYVAS